MGIHSRDVRARKVEYNTKSVQIHQHEFSHWRPFLVSCGGGYTRPREIGRLDQIYQVQSVCPPPSYILVKGKKKSTVIMKSPSSLESSVFALFYRRGMTVGSVTIKRGPLVSMRIMGSQNSRGIKPRQTRCVGSSTIMGGRDLSVIRTLWLTKVFGSSSLIKIDGLSYGLIYITGKIQVWQPKTWLELSQWRIIAFYSGSPPK